VVGRREIGHDERGLSLAPRVRLAVDGPRHESSV
jgi:hypothetical protein